MRILKETSGFSFKIYMNGMFWNGHKSIFVNYDYILSA